MNDLSLGRIYSGQFLVFLLAQPELLRGFRQNLGRQCDMRDFFIVTLFQTLGPKRGALLRFGLGRGGLGRFRTALVLCRFHIVGLKSIMARSRGGFNNLTAVKSR